MSEREQMVRTIISVGMIRRDVAADIADALLRSGWMRKPCPHEVRKPVLTEVGMCAECVVCGDQDFR